MQPGVRAAIHEQADMGTRVDRGRALHVGAPAVGCGVAARGERRDEHVTRQRRRRPSARQHLPHHVVGNGPEVAPIMPLGFKLLQVGSHGGQFLDR